MTQPFIVRADELTKGDIIKNPTGDLWQVQSEPEYRNQGICFEVLWLDVPSLDNTQTITFVPDWRFELLDYQPISHVEIAA